MSSMSSSRQALTELLGADAVARLLAAFGGTELYIPSVPNMHACHPIAQSVGLDAAMLLAKQYGTGRGGYRISLPVNMKRDLILESAGSSREVALKVGCSQRYVYSVRNAARRRA
jgi:hypothetical protein